MLLIGIVCETGAYSDRDRAHSADARKRARTWLSTSEERRGPMDKCDRCKSAMVTKRSAKENGFCDRKIVRCKTHVSIGPFGGVLGQNRPQVGF